MPWRGSGLASGLKSFVLDADGVTDCTGVSATSQEVAADAIQICEFRGGEGAGRLSVDLPKPAREAPLRESLAQRG